MRSIRHNQMKLEELTEPEWGDVAHDYHERDTKYGMAELNIVTVIQHPTGTVAIAPVLTASGYILNTLASIHGKS